MLLEIFLDGFLGLAHVDGQKDQPFIGELVAYLVDEGGLVSTEATPGGPNSSSTTLPLMESLVNFSPVVVVALKRGAGSLSLGPARAQIQARNNVQEIAPRNVRVLDMT